MKEMLELSLFKNAAERPRRKFVAASSGHSDTLDFDGVLVPSMAPTYPDQIPPVLSQQLQHIAYFHTPC